MLEKEISKITKTRFFSKDNILSFISEEGNDVNWSNVDWSNVDLGD